MLSKLLKKDLNKNMRWMWILFVSTIFIALTTRGCKELGQNIVFFKILFMAIRRMVFRLWVRMLEFITLVSKPSAICNLSLSLINV